MARIAARGIPYEVSLIYGLPHQTLDRFRASVAWCLDRGVPRVKAFPLMLLRGTPLYEDKESFGYVESEDPIPVAVQSQWFTRDDHAQMAELARWLDDDPPVIAPGDLAARAKLHPTHCTHEDTMSHRDCDYCTDRNGKPKRCYGTRQDALGAASHILRVRKVRLRVYRCEVDLGYHLTSDLDGGWDDGLW